MPCALCLVPYRAHAVQTYFSANVGYATAVFNNNYWDNSALGIYGTFGLMSETGLRGGINLGIRTGLGGGDVSVNNYNALVDVAYDVPTGAQVRPFIGATGGVMLSTLSIKGLGTQNRTDIVYGPMAGISYMIAPNAAIDLTYRYLFISNADTGFSTNYGNFSIGTRFMF